jgi:hypothetical protein
MNWGFEKEKGLWPSKKFPPHKSPLIRKSGLIANKDKSNHKCTHSIQINKQNIHVQTYMLVSTSYN